MKSLGFILLIMLFFQNVVGQTKHDSMNYKLIINCLNEETLNDTLIFKEYFEKTYEEVSLFLDSGQIFIDIAFFKDTKSLKFIGYGNFNLFFTEKFELCKIRKIEALANISTFCFGNGLLTLDTLILYNSGISEMPKSIEKCLNISYLDLSHNELTDFNNKISSLINLKKLVVTNNEIIVFPKDILDSRSIEVVNLQSNKISIIPKKILKLKSLRVINLMGNPIKRYPEDLLFNKRIEVYGIEEDAGQ